MPRFHVAVQSSGRATIVAGTKKEADAKARRGEYATTPQRPRWTALISTLTKADR